METISINVKAEVEIRETKAGNRTIYSGTAYVNGREIAEVGESYSCRTKKELMEMLRKQINK